ncbi:type III effector phosphothreonine lyase, partial [Salmonella enterica]|nr:type III effector phosphothreonine lyase [Salmonella enterica subsp. enterica serovar Typhimurium]EDZ6904430.1 type III effector phosphothreonine lyase [Salmonella enterica]EFP2823218.1 type III effector phosphothreonine lyase [Salmonella enterica]EGG3587665.1 type III effector phosphothreonine lyase [Salmonella enterica]EGT8237885.1 type III effector phosphothreonine lyase [Salmonella enterica]
MPINRPNLNLNIPPLNIVAAYDGAEIPSTNKHLKNNFNSLHNQMRKMPVSHFK